MGSACSTPPEAEKETTTSVVPAAQPTKQVVAKHSIKHGGSIRVEDHVREDIEEANVCASLLNPKFLEKYELVNPEPLGKGAFASVYHIKETATGEEWALKVVDKNHLSLDAGELQAIRWEAEAQMLCHEPGVVELKESFEVDDGGDLDKGFIYMVMEIMRGGELFDRIMAKSTYTECDAILVLRSIAKALANCHHHQVVHLDLKPENVLYVGEEGTPEGESVKICDFGISRTLDSEHPSGGQLVDGQCAPDGRLHGTPGYIAPEMILQQPFDHKCDVWQLGVLAYILISGIPPFEEPPNLEGTQAGMEQMFEYIKAGDFFPFDQYQPTDNEPNPWDVVTSDAKDFVQKALTPDTSIRPSMKELLLHPWIVNDETKMVAAKGHKLEGVNPRLKKMCQKARLKRSVRRLIIMNRTNKAATAFKAPHM